MKYWENEINELEIEINSKNKKHSLSNDVFISEKFVIKALKNESTKKRQNEIKVLNALGIISAIKSNYLIIQKREGEILNLTNVNFTEIFPSLKKELSKINSISIDDLETLDLHQKILTHYDFISDFIKNNNLIKINLDELKSFSKKFKNDFISHCDLNRNNILINRNREIILIDFEEVKYSNKYMDWITFASEWEIDIDEIKLISSEIDLDWKIFVELSIIWAIIIYKWNNEMKSKRDEVIYNETAEYLLKQIMRLYSHVE